MENLRKLQLIELQILKDVASICDKSNLKYYLIGGTLLGAVRHKGFIPWDDDIDIVMFRKDYDALFHIMQTEFRDKYFVQRFETDNNYTRYIMKIRLNGTKHIEEENQRIDMNQGIYIDIFPLDFVVKNNKDLKRRGKKLRRLFAYKNIKHKSFINNKMKFFLSRCLYPFFLLVPDSLLNYSFKRTLERDNEKKCDFVTNFASHFKWEKQLFPIDYYGEGIYLRFEDQEFRCPNNYVQILERLYGKEFMNIPPIEKREQHRIIQVDFGTYEQQFEK